MDNRIDNTDSLVSFRNTRDVSGRGTLIHVTRSNVIFEVYNPYSVVQMSEVLQSLQILRKGRFLYSGRAVVSNIIATGLMTIVSATLVDSWSDLAGMTPGPELRREVEDFVKKWEVTHALRPSYQVVITKLRSFLGELSRWLEQVEVESSTPAQDDSQELKNEFCAEVEIPLAPKIRELFENFEHEAGAVALEESDAHRSFARREIHPLILCAPFVHRTFTKPLGYAGDYEMVNMMLRNPSEGPTTYAKVVNSFNINTAPAAAHRNRIEMLKEILEKESARAASQSRQLSILNVGCGPAVEVQQFIHNPLSSQCTLELLDFNEETLNYTKLKIADAERAANRKLNITFIHKSVDDLLKEAAGIRETQPSKYDLVYCAGLFDYLSNKTCKRLVQLFYNWTTPGGLVAATNVHKNNPVRYYMEHLLEWHLIYRDEAGMQSLSPADSVERIVRTDSTGVNVFLEIRKAPGAEHAG